MTITEHEKDILRHISNGETQKEVGANLNISRQTVKNTLTIIRLKLGATSTTHAVTLAIQNNLL